MVLTGRNRERSTSIAVAPSNTSTAAPIADSICTTSGDDGSVGSTVLSLRISGRPRMPSRGRPASAPAARGRTTGCWCGSTRCRARSAAASASSGGVCAVSRSTRRPSLAPYDEVAALDVGRRAAADLGGVGGAGGREPLHHRRVRSGAEVVGVGDGGVAEAGVEQGVEDAGRLQRRVEVAVARAGTTRATGRPASRPASGRRHAAWARGSAGSRAAGRPRRGRRTAPARRACRRGCGSCS